jgi:hypothetical protein
MLTTAEDAAEDDPLTDHLVRDYFRGARTEWPDDEGVEFHPTHGEWIRIFTSAGFEIQELLEPQVPEGSTTSYTWAPVEWARRWPIEEVWKLRKRG